MSVADLDSPGVIINDIRKRHDLRWYEVWALCKLTGIRTLKVGHMRLVRPADMPRLEREIERYKGLPD